MKEACEDLLLVLKNMLRYYDNLEKDYYRENGINQQLDMEKKNGKMDYDTDIFNLPNLQK